MTQHSTQFPDCFYRVAVKGIFVKDGKILLCKDTSGSVIRPTGWDWDLPGGGLDFGEDLHQGLKREIKEEMGLTVKSVSEKPIYVWTVDHGPGRNLDWYWVCLICFVVEIEDIEAFVPSDECVEVKFFSKEELAAAREDICKQTQPLIEAFNPNDFM